MNNVKVERGRYVAKCHGCGRERKVSSIEGASSGGSLLVCEMCEGSLRTALNAAAALGGESLFDLTVQPGAEFTVMVNGQMFLTGRADSAGPTISQLGG